MTAANAVRELMKRRSVTQAELAEKVGMKNQSNVSEALKRDMRVSVFVRFVDALGYKLVIEGKVKGEYEDDVMVLTDGL